MKYFKKRKLEKFLGHLEDKTIKWPEKYIEIHKDKINLIKWLLNSYDGFTASTPKEFLKYLLSPVIIHKENNIEKTIFLYHWIYYNKITGF